MDKLQLELFSDLNDVRLEDVFTAYFHCRQHKRRTRNALKFELNFEHNLIKLWRQINTGNYEIGRSIAFIVDKPVKREIFAADFKDRVVHHLLMDKLMSFFEADFSPQSYSCRPNKGLFYAVNEVKKAIVFAKNTAPQSYILRLDIQAFFMSISHPILYQKLKAFCGIYKGLDKNHLLTLLKKIVFHLPQNNCFRKGSLKNWDGFPAHKSLFSAKKNTGLAIGNLTSQIFANFYLNDLDKIMEHVPGLFYGRYVDDLVLIHPKKDVLLALKNEIDTRLRRDFALSLHPKKIYLQPLSNGCPFLGWWIHPHKIVSRPRLKGSFFKRIHALNFFFETEQVKKPLLLRARCILNSYFGFLQHYQTWYLRRKGWIRLSPTIKRYFSIGADLKKIVLKK